MKKEILLVEYDSRTIQIIKDLFMDPVFELSVAADGEVAKRMLDNKTYDLVITAAMLPKFHGFNLSKHIAQNYPGTKIIVISGVYRGISFKKQATIQYGADDFFEKPINEKDFKKKVMDILNLKQNDLKGDQFDGVTTTNVQMPDTTKVPTLEHLENEKQRLTSQDIFGDIIDDVEKVKPLNINIEDEIEREEDKKVEKKLREIDKEAHDPSKTNFIPRKEVIKETKIDLDNLVKKVEVKKPEKKYKDIDKEIEKKLEETLSGLGIKSKQTTQKPKGEQKKSQEKTEEKQDKNQLGAYQLLGLIARGGMAEIYKAKKKGVKGFEKVIAIKKILSGYGEDNSYIEMFVDEAKIAAELSHPNIVQIYDFGKKDDYYFIAMEYVMGKDLRLILRKLKERDEKLPVELSVYIIIKILEALEYAHSAKDSKGKELKIVHRDVSPPNILVSYNGDIKLTDFGVSKATIKEHQTISGALKGKLLYMSPEQAKGEKDIDFRSDIFSAGIILFELVTGEKLFLDSTEMGVLKKVQEGKIVKPSEFDPEIDKDLERIILKSLEIDINKRYQNAAEMIKDLEEYILNHFQHLPSSLHLAHFMVKVFREEMLKEGVKLDLKPLPFDIKRKKKKKKEEESQEHKKKDKKVPEDIPEDVKQKSETEVIEIPKEDMKPPLKELEEKDREGEIKEIVLEDIESESLGEESKENVVNISFDEDISIGYQGMPEDKVVKDKPIIKQQPKSGQTKTRVGNYKHQRKDNYDIYKYKKNYEKESSSKLVIYLIASIIIIGMIIYFVFLSKSDEEINYGYSTQKSKIEKKAKTSVTNSPQVLDDLSQQESQSNDQTVIQDQTNNQTQPQSNSIDITTQTQNTPQQVVKNQQKINNNKQATQTPKKQKVNNIKNNITKSKPKKQQKPKQTVTKPQQKNQTNDQKPAKQRSQTNIQPSSSEISQQNQNTQQTEQITNKQSQQNQEIQAQNIDQTVKQTQEQKPVEQPVQKAVEPAIKEGDIVALSLVDSQPVAVSTPIPKVSPYLLRRLGGVQSVMVGFLVNHRGNIEKIRILKKSKSKAIDNTVLKTVKKWKFKPATKNGMKVKVWKTKMIILR